MEVFLPLLGNLLRLFYLCTVVGSKVKILMRKYQWYLKLFRIKLYKLFLEIQNM